MKKTILNNITKLPTFINKIFLVLNRFPSIIYGKDYTKLTKVLLEETMYNNENDLIKLVNYSIDNVPYYKKYKKIFDIKGFESQFDFIDKDIVSHNFDNLKSRAINESDYDFVSTGGTSGKPLKLLVHKNRFIIELAVMHSMWSRVGFMNHTRAVIRNKRLDSNQDYIINPITKEIIFDGFRLNDFYFKKIYEIIKKFNIEYIHAYPSTAYEFSKFINKKKLNVSFVKAFLSGSENVHKYQKEFIESKLGVRFYSWFGHSEKLILGGYCRDSEVYHIEPRYGYFELVDENGHVIKTPGEIGEIVGTTINNYGMPLIRYKTGDFAEYVGDYCNKCQRRTTLIKNIKGRWNGNKIYGADGSIITSTALNFHDDLYSVIEGLQYIQKQKGFLDVLIIKNTNFTEKDHQKLKFHYKSKFSSETVINIKFVDKLIRKPNGKFVELISSVSQ